MKNVYGIKELATATGLDAGLISAWYRRGKLPAPNQVLAATPIWWGPEIEAWIEATRRP